MNDHPIEHTYQFDVPGGRVTYKVTEPYLTSGGMACGLRTSLMVERFTFGGPQQLFLGPIQEAEDFMKGCLDTLGQIAALDGGE